MSNFALVVGLGAGFPLVKTRMSAADALALHAYIIGLEWQAYRAQR